MSILMYKQRHRHPNYRKTPKCNYAHIGYIATRPGAVKNEGMRHGLFGKLAPGEVCEFETWQEAARLVRELSYRACQYVPLHYFLHPGNRRRAGLAGHGAWQEYIDRHILTLAKRNGIRVQDLQWVAAHHNERGHPLHSRAGGRLLRQPNGGLPCSMTATRKIWSATAKRQRPRRIS